MLDEDKIEFDDSFKIDEFMDTLPSTWKILGTFNATGKLNCVLLDDLMSGGLRVPFNSFPAENICCKLAQWTHEGY